MSSSDVHVFIYKCIYVWYVYIALFFVHTSANVSLYEGEIIFIVFINIRVMKLTVWLTQQSSLVDLKK